MSAKTSHIMLPSGVKFRTLNKSMVGSGTGSVLLDGGQGGQSSYSSLEEYLKTTNKPASYPIRSASTAGMGLSDKISGKLQGLKISQPKRKNITLSI
jgi:hypothetical protein